MPAPAAPRATRGTSPSCRSLDPMVPPPHLSETMAEAPSHRCLTESTDSFAAVAPLEHGQVTVYETCTCDHVRILTGVWDARLSRKLLVSSAVTHYSAQFWREISEHTHYLRWDLSSWRMHASAHEVFHETTCPTSWASCGSLAEPPQLHPHRQYCRWRTRQRLVGRVLVVVAALSHTAGKLVGVCQVSTRAVVVAARDLCGRSLPALSRLSEASPEGPLLTHDSRRGTPSAVAPFKYGTITSPQARWPASPVAQGISGRRTTTSHAETCRE